MSERGVCEISSCSISSRFEQIVSTTALYNKLQGIELGVSQALLAETASANINQKQ